MKTKPLPTQEYLQECFDYNALTGEIRWRVRPEHHFKSVSMQKMWNKKFAGKKIGCLDGSGYFRFAISNKQYILHRAIWKLIHNEEPPIVDHIDGDKLNNAIENLRAATSAENNRNRKPKPNTKSSLKGVSKSTTGSNWYARICADHKVIYLGTFDSKKEASAAYQKAADELHGKFARYEK